MLGTMWDLEIRMIIPFDEIIKYPDDFVDEYIEEPYFKVIRDLLEIDIDVRAIVEEIYHNRHKNPSVSIYFSKNSLKEYILLDTYMGATEQLDLINIGIRCIGKHGGIIRKLSHEFYIEKCKYNILYTEGNHEIGIQYGVDFSLYNENSEEKYREIIQGKRLRFFKEGKLLKDLI